MLLLHDSCLSQSRGTRDDLLEVRVLGLVRSRGRGDTCHFGGATALVVHLGFKRVLRCWMGDQR